MSHKHSIYDSDMHFLIDPAARSIKNQSKKTIVVRGDHNSERFTFEIPRMVEGHDMSLCNLVQIHYLNANYADVYTVDDLQVYTEDETVVILSWAITENATQNIGSLHFAVHFLCIDNDGNVEYALRTIPHKEITVADTITNTETIAEEYPDILAQWEARLAALEQNGDSGSGNGKGIVTIYAESFELDGTETKANMRVVYTDGTDSYFEFSVPNGTNGIGIRSIEKTSTEGLVDTYTILYTDDTTSTFTVTNGSGSGGEDNYLTDVQIVTEEAESEIKEATLGDDSKTITYASGSNVAPGTCWWLTNVPEFKKMQGRTLKSISFYSDTAGIAVFKQSDIEVSAYDHTLGTSGAETANNSMSDLFSITISENDANGQKQTYLLDGTDERVQLPEGTTEVICPKTIGIFREALTATIGFNNAQNGVAIPNNSGIVAGFAQRGGGITANTGTYQSFIFDFTYNEVNDTKNIMVFSLKNGTELRCDLSYSEAEKITTNVYPLLNKKLSIIGDSISTYSGYLPQGYASRHPKGAITNVEQTWWKQLLNETKMTLLVNASYSGSTVTGKHTTTSGYDTVSTTNPYPACSDKRINDLSDGTNNPDIIICYIGINDFGANRAVPIGDFRGLTEIPTDSSTGMSTFSEGYGLMLKKIMAKYPTAIVYCCTLPPTSGDIYNPNGAFPVKNAFATMGEYNEAIREIARNMNARVIEFAEAGITYWNTSTYLEDGVHPNAEGMVKLKDKAKTTLLNDY